MYRFILPIVILTALLLCLSIAHRQSLWSDEFFSLAMASGHSLEHPAKKARAQWGDFIEGSAAQRAEYWKTFSRINGAGPREVLRAVERSDTSPPLYYLLLHFWMLLLGSNALALRSLSILFFLLSIWIFWKVARRHLDSESALLATVIFALCPLSLRYATEGRHYSLLLLFCLLTIHIFQSTWEKELSGAAFMELFIVALAGFYTHYFFAFLFLPCSLLALYRKARWRKRLLGLFALLALALSPWYLKLPSMLETWRVTADWLHGSPGVGELLLRPFLAPYRLFSGLLQPRISSALVFIAILLLGRERSKSSGSLDELLLIALWGPIASLSFFDGLLDYHSSSEIRYHLAALPALCILYGQVLAALRKRWGLSLPLLLLATTVLLQGGWRDNLIHPFRHGEDYRSIALWLEERLGAGDLLIVDSIPSGVIGIAHYMDDESKVAAWVEALGQRELPESGMELIARKQRVFLLSIHRFVEQTALSLWLEKRAMEITEERFALAKVEVFISDRPLGFFFAREQ